MEAPQDRRVAELVRWAQQAMAANSPDEAARAWDQVLALAPRHPEALVFHGVFRLQRRDPRGARDFLIRAVAEAPNNPIAALNLSFAERELGNNDGEMTALSQALAADPYCYPALLAQGALLERTGHRRRAARIYQDALKIVPSDDNLAPSLRAAVARARIAARENIEELDSFLEKKLGTVRARYSQAALRRFDEAKDALTGRKKIYNAAPSLLHFPQLPAIPFFERDLFPWMPTVEAQTDAIREELFSLLRKRKDGFKPYINYPPGAPLNQWEELNKSPRWSVLYLCNHGKRNDEYWDACPRTTAALEAVPLSTIPGAAPDIVFSALEPHTRIPPHTGVTNARLIVHLPLIIPEKCGFRVANEVREWKLGEAWAFDDTIEHEAWNDSDLLRVILIFETWHPALSNAERELAASLVAGYFEYEDGK
jgi:aspartyl/asparaginyl beta-hydroxylase (cupin superfamily)